MGGSSCQLLLPWTPCELASPGALPPLPPPGPQIYLDLGTPKFEWDHPYAKAAPMAKDAIAIATVGARARTCGASWPALGLAGRANACDGQPALRVPALPEGMCG